MTQPYENDPLGGFGKVFTQAIGLRNKQGLHVSTIAFQYKFDFILKLIKSSVSPSYDVKYAIYLGNGTMIFNEGATLTDEQLKEFSAEKIIINTTLGDSSHFCLSSDLKDK